MRAADSHSIGKRILVRDRSHFDVRRIWPILPMAASESLEIYLYPGGFLPCPEQNGLKPRKRI